MADGAGQHLLSRFIDIPRGWPEAVKSAVLVAAGLVHTAVVQVWGVTESSPQVTTRLSTEAERAKHRAAELEALVRILQARLEAVPPQHRPDYAPKTRLEILAYRAAFGLTLAEVARRVQVTTQTIRNWMAASRDPAWGLVAAPTPVNRIPDWTARPSSTCRSSSRTSGRARSPSSAPGPGWPSRRRRSVGRGSASS